MSHECEGTDAPLPQTWRELALRLSADPRPAVQAIAWAIAAETLFSEQDWTQRSLDRLQQDTHRSRSTVKRYLKQMEAEAILRRRHLGGRPGKGNGRGDYYQLAVGQPPEHEEEGAPTRGPTEERPEGVPTPSGRHDGSPTPGSVSEPLPEPQQGPEEPGKPDQP